MKSIKNIKNFVNSVIGIISRKISDCTPKKYNLAIVVIAKNEQDYIKEWVAFHKVMGGDKINLYDNDSTDNIHYESAATPLMCQIIKEQLEKL